MSIDISVQVSADIHIKDLHASLSKVWKTLFNADHQLQIVIEESEAAENKLIGPHKMALSIGYGENPRVQVLISHLGHDDDAGHSDRVFDAVIYPYRYRESFLLMALVGIAFSDVFERPILDDANRIGLGTSFEGKKIIELLSSYNARNFEELTEKFCNATNISFGTSHSPLP